MDIKCPHLVSKVTRYSRDYDCCDLTERPSGRIKLCLLMSNKTCDEWDKIQDEWEAEYGDAIREWRKEQKGAR